MIVRVGVRRVEVRSTTSTIVLANMIGRAVANVVLVGDYLQRRLGFARCMRDTFA